MNHTTTTNAIHLYTAAEKRQRVFAIMAASSGNLVEWFDFHVYAFCAIYFAPSGGSATGAGARQRWSFPC